MKEYDYYTKENCDMIYVFQLSTGDFDFLLWVFFFFFILIRYLHSFNINTKKLSENQPDHQNLCFRKKLKKDETNSSTNILD